MVRANTGKIGFDAETIAQAQLQNAGLSLIARNVRFAFGEIDLIMRQDSTLVFVEVRMRNSAQFGGALQSVDRSKRRRIARAAQAFLQKNQQYLAWPCRFDVVAIGPTSDQAQIDWQQGAFTLDDC